MTYQLDVIAARDGYARITAFSFWHRPETYYTKTDVRDVARGLVDQQYAVTIEYPGEWTPDVPAEIGG